MTPETGNGTQATGTTRRTRYCTLSFQILNIEAIEAIEGAKVSLQCVYTERTRNESGAFSARQWGMDVWTVMRVMEDGGTLIP